MTYGAPDHFLTFMLVDPTSTTQRTGVTGLGFAQTIDDAEIYSDAFTLESSLDSYYYNDDTFSWASARIVAINNAAVRHLIHKTYYCNRAIIEWDWDNETGTLGSDLATGEWRGITKWLSDTHYVSVGYYAFSDVSGRDIQYALIRNGVVTTGPDMISHDAPDLVTPLILQAIFDGETATIRVLDTDRVLLKSHTFSGVEAKYQIPMNFGYSHLMPAALRTHYLDNLSVDRIRSTSVGAD